VYDEAECHSRKKQRSKVSHLMAVRKQRETDIEEGTGDNIHPSKAYFPQ
jgi:hypothetical protein